MKPILFVAIAMLLGAPLAMPQTDARDIQPILKQQLQSPQVVTFQLQQFLMKKAPELPAPSSAQQWTAEAKRIRRHLLQDVIFHGWPKQWVTAPPQFQDLGTVKTGKGYQLHKLRYEIVPGFYATALLYEPDPLNGKAPAVLDVMGHFPKLGNKQEFEQKLCINQALKGMIALNPEWIGMGELNVPGNSHWYQADLNLVGMNGVGLFYLAMRRGLDYLAQDPHVDASRLAVTGLSGGGWQTIVLSSLDPRVLVSVPVAGYATLSGRVARVHGEPGDLEQNPSDFLIGSDYSTLTAMRAPRPTLLINNAEDSCCFRAPLVKPYIYDAIKPFFNLYGKEAAFQFHQNTNISAHNYGLDNRQHAYAFLVKHFHLPAGGKEIPVGQDLKTYKELLVGVPKDNLTILGLARKMAAEIKHSPITSKSRAELRQVVRYHPVSVHRAWGEYDTWHNQVESISYRFEMSNGLSATGVWLKQVSTSANAPLTIVLNDGGREAAATESWGHAPEVADRMQRDEQLLVLNLLFTGDAAPDQHAYLLTEMLAATGARPLGMETAQLIGIASWARNKWHPARVRVETTGIRTQVASLTAAALEPHLFSRIENYGGMRSFQYLLEKPVSYESVPDLFCLDLYKDFDISQLEELASPARISEFDSVHAQGGH
ncbi:MAG: alpha/beta hydrolase family protein [Bryobacteraceae bacterium]